MAWLRRKPGAQYAGIGIRKFDDWLKNGLRHCRVGGAVLVKDTWIDDFIMQHEATIETEQQRVDKIVNDVVKGLL